MGGWVGGTDPINFFIGFVFIFKKHLTTEQVLAA